MFPSQSQWESPEVNSAWYGRRAGAAGQQVCSIDGFNFLTDLQLQLRDRLSATGPLPSFQGSISSDNIQVSGWDQNGTPYGPGWDVTLLRALYAVAARDRAPSAFLQAILNDARRYGMPISPATQQTALWEAYHNAGYRSDGSDYYGLGSPSDILIPTGSMLPVLGRRPPVPFNRLRSSGSDCIAQSMPIQTAPPLVSPTLVRFSPWLVFGALVVTVIGAVVITHRAPRQIELRGGRR